MLSKLYKVVFQSYSCSIIRNWMYYKILILDLKILIFQAHPRMLSDTWIGGLLRWTVLCHVPLAAPEEVLCCHSRCCCVKWCPHEFRDEGFCNGTLHSGETINVIHINCKLIYTLNPQLSLSQRKDFSWTSSLVLDELLLKSTALKLFSSSVLCTGNGFTPNLWIKYERLCKI